MSRTRGWAAVTTAALCLAGPVPPARGVDAPLMQALQPAPQMRPGTQYSGAPVDVDYQGADLRLVLRQLADVGPINLVLDPSVPPDAKVDLKLTQVPWDQVFDIVLATNRLVRETTGAVVRVLAEKVQRDEARARLESLTSQAEAQAAQSVTHRSFSLNYARGPDLEKILKASILSKYGTTQFDERTSTLVVTDLPDRLNQAADLVARLDQAEPQVEIEARIVQTNHDSARALGIQWGFNGRMSPELGNTTNWAFPNSGGIGGRAQDSAGKPASQGPTDPRGSVLQTTGTAVNLPVTGATAGVGLSMGAVNGAFNLDVALTALEHQGKVRLLSTPRVTTQNNKEAEMTQGFQIPFQTVSNNTATIQFRDAALKLTVTPHITGANTVIMEVLLENGVPDFSRAVNGNPSISTQRANTKVQVPDGVTTVIGGIVASTETTSHDSTPGASRLPLLGWLFRRSDTSAQSQELLIFITPRIIRGTP